MLPLPPAPSESHLLGSILEAAVKIEGQYPVKELKKRAGLSAINGAQALAWDQRDHDWKMKRRAAGWLVGFCFSFREGTIGALWSFDFTFHSEFYIIVEPQVLKRNSEECAYNPQGTWLLGARRHAVGTQSDPVHNGRYQVVREKGRREGLFLRARN